VARIVGMGLSQATSNYARFRVGLSLTVFGISNRSNDITFPHVFPGSCFM